MLVSSAMKASVIVTVDDPEQQCVDSKPTDNSDNR